MPASSFRERGPLSWAVPAAALRVLREIVHDELAKLTASSS